MNASISPPIFVITPGAGNLPKLILTAPDGARVEIYLQGGQVTSWIPAGGQERLFLSPAARFGTGIPICGGIPVIFPQFSKFGSLPLHGLARWLPWDFISADTTDDHASATLRLHDSETSRQQWAFTFLAELTVIVDNHQLAVTLTITNTGAEPFNFTVALHTYLAVTDLAATYVEGLAGLRYCDAAAGWSDHQQTNPRLHFAGEVNRIYFNAPTETRLVEPNRITRIEAVGFPDVVVWNPAVDKCATMADLEPDDYQRFVCVEAVAVGNPIVLAPGERWQGMQRLVV